MSKQGIIFNIQHFSVHDGPGIRTTVFLKGCPLSCGWCHNPEGISKEIQKLNGDIIGRKVTPEEVFDEIKKDVVFFDESGGGVTFSGGEPLAQPGFLWDVLTLCNQHGIHSAIDTTGYANLELIKKLEKKTDLFLYDVKFIDPVLHIKHTGVSNTEILENLGHLLTTNKPVIIRFPMIPGITFMDKNIDDIIQFLNKYENKPEVNLLPYHRIATGKYEKFNFKYKIVGKELTESQIRKTEELFIKAGFKTKIGG
jgi:pyruvate formate lyase activating enzyme